MVRRALFRLQDIKEAIGRIRALLYGKTFDEMYADPNVRAAFERYLEIASEASRHIPDELKQQHGPSIPWRNVADLGNVLRHTYHKADARALWEIYINELDDLEAAIDRMLVAEKAAE